MLISKDLEDSIARVAAIEAPLDVNIVSGTQTADALESSEIQFYARLSELREALENERKRVTTVVNSLKLAAVFAAFLFICALATIGFQRSLITEISDAMFIVVALLLSLSAPLIAMRVNRISNRREFLEEALQKREFLFREVVKIKYNSR